MTPISTLAVQKLISILTTGNALQQTLAAIEATAQVQVPVISTTQIVASSAAPDLADNNLQMSYPRVCVYTNGIQNKQIEKFRSFSGTLTVVVEIWASANLLTQTDQWIHFYIEAVTELLRSNIGDWGNGFFFSGKYDVQFQPPKAGGFGFVESSKLTITLNVSLP
jgi:hypothetical protein